MIDTVKIFLEQNAVIIAIIGPIIAFLALILTQRHRSQERIEKRAQREAEYRAQKMEVEQLKETIQHLQQKTKSDNTSSDKERISSEMIQEEKIMYVKFLYIIPERLPCSYEKYIRRLDQKVPIWTESVHYGFNRFNQINNDLEVVSSSKKGIVDLQVVYPWKTKRLSHSTRLLNPHMISERLSGSDIYMTVGTYCNGFREGEEDFAIMAEHPTKVGRLIIDFSSIPNLDLLFEKEPNAYRYSDPKQRKHTPIYGIQQVNKGVYSIEASNLEMGEIIELDFHINWDYLGQEGKLNGGE